MTGRKKGEKMVMQEEGKHDGRREGRQENRKELDIGKENGQMKEEC